MLPECLTEKSKYNLNDLTPKEFWKIIFAEADTITPRSPIDAFTLEEMLIIASSDAFARFDFSDKSFLWDAIDAESISI